MPLAALPCQLGMRGRFGNATGLLNARVKMRQGERPEDPILTAMVESGRFSI